MTYVVLVVVAVAGLVASIVCNLMGWLRIEPWLGEATFVLHVGAMALLIPLIHGANGTDPRPFPRRRGNLSHIFAALPRWARVAMGILFAYALLNFSLFLWFSRQYPRSGVPFYLELRGFSGHWMLFYGLEAAGFLALRRIGAKAAPSAPPNPALQPTPPSRRG